jgi:hypothetical protein
MLVYLLLKTTQFNPFPLNIMLLLNVECKIYLTRKQNTCVVQSIRVTFNSFPITQTYKKYLEAEVRL